MSFGPCMCGDTQCSSCGPAQGNFRCPLCGVWADDGCMHFDDAGQPKVEYEAQFKAQAEADQLAEEAYARILEEADEVEPEENV